MSPGRRRWRRPPARRWPSLTGTTTRPPWSRCLAHLRPLATPSALARGTPFASPLALASTPRLVLPCLPPECLGRARRRPQSALAAPRGGTRCAPVCSRTRGIARECISGGETRAPDGCGAAPSVRTRNAAMSASRPSRRTSLAGTRPPPASPPEPGEDLRRRARPRARAGGRRGLHDGIRQELQLRDTSGSGGGRAPGRDCGGGGGARRPPVRPSCLLLCGARTCSRLCCGG